jgi:hypothetical protein
MSDAPEAAVLSLQEIEPLDGEETKAAIARELYLAMGKLGAPPALLALIGSYGDTLDDGDVLTYLRANNDTGTYCRSIICRRLEP